MTAKVHTNNLGSVVYMPHAHIFAVMLSGVERYGAASCTLKCIPGLWMLELLFSRFPLHKGQLTGSNKDTSTLKKKHWLTFYANISSHSSWTSVHIVCECRFTLYANVGSHCMQMSVHILCEHWFTFYMNVGSHSTWTSVHILYECQFTFSMNVWHWKSKEQKCYGASISAHEHKRGSQGEAYANICLDCNTRQNVVVCRATECFSLKYQLQADSVCLASDWTEAVFLSLVTHLHCYACLALACLAHVFVLMWTRL